jgi:hypothetical protein
MAERRTTIVAREEDLATFSDEARTRGVSLGRLLGEVIGERAEDIRRSKRPRLATFRAQASIRADSELQTPAARPYRDV